MSEPSVQSIVATVAKRHARKSIEQTFPTLTVVTPWLDHPEYIPGFENAVKGADEVIIIDTGSTGENYDALLAMAQRLPNGRIIDHIGGGNYGHWCNAGFRAAAGDRILFLNNDVYSEGDWLTPFREIGDGNLYGPGLTAPAIGGKPFKIAGIDSSAFVFLSGWCIGATRETWERLIVEGCEGPWDTVLFPGAGYWEDNDLCFRAQMAGMGLRHLPVPLRHHGDGTSRYATEYYRDVDRNRAAFIKRVSEVIG